MLGAGRTEAPFERGSGEGLGVHILTGPVAVEHAEPGDVLEVRILDIQPRPSRHASHAGRCFGSNAAASWGFHYNDLIEEPKPREVITIFELDTSGEPFASAVYNYRMDAADRSAWHRPRHHRLSRRAGGPHAGHSIARASPRDQGPGAAAFRHMGLAPAEADFVSSVPPGHTGGNIDDWRIGKGARDVLPGGGRRRIFLGRRSARRAGRQRTQRHRDRGSLTGDFEFILHKHRDLGGTVLEGLAHPMLETEQQWSVYGFTFANYLAELGPDAQAEVARHASIDRAMRDAFRKLRRFLMTVHRLSEDEAISLMSVAADFGITQVVDGNWGVHGSIRKSIFG